MNSRLFVSLSLVLASLASLALAGGAAANSNAPRIECLQSHGVKFMRHPSSCTLYEHGGSGTAILRSMKWKHWGGPSTTGKGKIAYFDHPDYGGRVKVTLKRLYRSNCAKGRFYIRARVRTTSGLAKGNKFNLWLGSGCPALARPRGSNYRVPVFVQGRGVVLQSKPEWLLAKRNVRPPALSGYDGLHAHRWKGWGGSKSVARGTYIWNTPDGSSLRDFAARIELIHPRPCGGFQVYRRVGVHFTGKAPPGMKKAIGFASEPYGCHALETVSRREGCAEVVIRNPDGSIYAQTHHLHTDGVGCKKGRKVAKARMADDGAGGSRYYGFSCRDASDGSRIRCKRGSHKHVAWRLF